MVLLAATSATSTRPARSAPVTPTPKGTAAAPATGQVIYAPPGKWIQPPPAPTQGATASDAPLRFLYTDQQVRIGEAGEETYNAYRIRILKPEALQIGNVSLAWNPSSGTMTVHRLHIIRDGQVIDILKDQRFKVIQREGGLEQSILDGRLTAVLQAPGLHVGDELEFAFTVLERDPTIGDHAFGLAQLPLKEMPGAFRYQMHWPETRKLAWRATRDLPQAVPGKADGQITIAYELRDPGSVIANDGAPARYNMRRLIEYSDFASWGDISRRFAGLFDKAATVAPASPLRAEAAKIRAASADPVERAQAALRLVQDQIRYVYVGLDGGNYRPASADETWQRRFGDCKAKTALLLALLRELGIEAEAVLVNPVGDDGADARLPNPGIFNHVLVRARIGGAGYWLDGTRLGDRYLDMLPAPSFRWALALRTAGSELEKIAPVPFKRPQYIGFVDIDASAGFDRPAKVKARNVLRDDEAFATRTQLAGMSAQDADRAVRDYWREEMGWVEADKVAWSYDERRTTLQLSVEGEGKPGWKGDATSGRRLDIPGAGFFPPDLRRRPKEQDQTAPWATNFPRFKCTAATIRLPTADAGMRWMLYAEPMDRSLAGTAYWRASGMKADIVRTVLSTRIDRPEIGADEARQANDAIPGFNNNISNVYEEKAQGKVKPDPAREILPFGDAVDWATGNPPACSAPAGKGAN
jgi:hypothetical protein